MPAWLIPIIVQIGGKLIDLAFDALAKKPADVQTKCLDKIEECDKHRAEDLGNDLGR